MIEDVSYFVFNMHALRNYLEMFPKQLLEDGFFK